MMRARNPLTRALPVLLSLSLALPVLFAQGKKRSGCLQIEGCRPCIQYRERQDGSGVIPASSLSLFSQAVDGPSESSIFSSSETAGATDSSGLVATETVL